MDFNQFWGKLSPQGYKMTPNRQQILQILTVESNWLTAKSLHEQLLARQIRINLSTVCRNLETLYHMGVLCRVDRERNGVFSYRWRDTKEHHHHLICLSCGKIIPLLFCPLDNLKTHHTKGFRDLECQFEVYGHCRDCQSQPSPSYQLDNA